MGSISTDKELFRGIHGISDTYDLVIVGAGLSGAVIAEQASKRSGLRSLVIDKRNHIGGNCYDYVDEHGIRVSFLLELKNNPIQIKFFPLICIKSFFYFFFQYNLIGK